jgi:ATP-binding cassette subfamily C (CFTR/MRP) protein 4
VNDEEETLLPPLTDKPVQKETVESKRTGSVGVNIFMRYIRAGGCGIVGLSCLFTIFAITSATILLANWWLGRWANSERIRYGLINTTDNCSSINQSLISTMSNEEWFKERDKFFYVLCGKYSSEFDKNKFYFLGLSLLSVGLLFIRTLSYFISCHITARSLHNQMFNALLRAPVFFFDSNPIGQKIFEIKFLIK